MRPPTPLSRLHRRTAFALVVSGTALGIAGTDLVLPAVPSLPAALGGSAQTAQYVLAAYVLGTSLGLLAFGALGARYKRRLLLAVSLALFGTVSIASALAPNLGALVALRFLQGALGAAPAVFAPGFIRSLYGDEGMVAAMGRLGSVEALAPALAPLGGAALLALGGWQLSFLVVGALALAMAGVMLLFGSVLPASAPPPAGSGGYRRLLGDPVFLRYAGSQALSLGALLVFVFGAPAVFAGPLGLGVSAFVTLQIAGVACFIAGANVSGRATKAFGTERTILGGTALQAAAFACLLAYALGGGTSPVVVIGLFLFVNLGFGLRGPAGFHRAMVAAGGDDARGAALVVLGLLGAGAVGTAIAAPFIEDGLAPLVAVAFATILGAVLLLVLLPKLAEEPSAPAPATG
ncbi:MFS transporter [Aurantimonas sp. Leaf443]|uniref:MFS transporter n=1 Tax=Aurantimonas sp. Leaf443 TaxID=1736378 RepID=UPI0006FECC4A|nr:MFS transporter [Aurantimonas sp. Leaf443]KQT82191.1 MFS transporter [Aurantimonas sp. Leaf443]